LYHVVPNICTTWYLTFVLQTADVDAGFNGTVLSGFGGFAPNDAAINGAIDVMQVDDHAAGQKP
jgi:hypothetical protein